MEQLSSLPRKGVALEQAGEQQLKYSEINFTSNFLFVASNAMALILPNLNTFWVIFLIWFHIVFSHQNVLQDILLYPLFQSVFKQLKGWI